MGKRTLNSYKREKGAAFISKNPYFLIVCEGTVTEPSYFRDFPYYKDFGDRDKHGNLNPDSAVRIIPNAGQHKSVIEIAYREFGLMKKKYGKSALNPSDVWCVFDCDYESDEGNRNFHEAIDMAKKYGFNAVYSIQCFELWYVLHFNYLVSAISRPQYNEIISRSLGIKYEHETEGMYDLLINNQQTALKNATKLFVERKTNNELRTDPITMVHALVLKLNQAYDALGKNKLCN